MLVLSLSVRKGHYSSILTLNAAAVVLRVESNRIESSRQVPFPGGPWSLTWDSVEMLSARRLQETPINDELQLNSLSNVVLKVDLERMRAFEIPERREIAGRFERRQRSSAFKLRSSSRALQGA